MNIRDIGEFNLINSIKKIVERPHGADILSIGDDAAAFLISDSKFCLMTTDMCLEDIHFDLSYFSLFQVGWKTMTSNLSDIAAMGGQPTFAVVSLGVPVKSTKEDIEELYKGMIAIADQYGARIIGGDTCASPDKLILSITLLGEVDKDKIVTRSGAQRQDLICVTGDLGKSAAGMKMLREFRTKGKNNRSFPAFYKREEDWQEVIKAHLEPVPRLKEAQVLLEEYKPTAMIDISDGLSSEIRHICEESDLGAYIYLERIPVHIDADKIARFSGMDPIEWALNSGEEFELVFTLPREQAEPACKHIRLNTGTEATVIGEIRPKSDGICAIDKNKDTRPLAIKGYDHFKK